MQFPSSISQGSTLGNFFSAWNIKEWAMLVLTITGLVFAGIGVFTLRNLLPPPDDQLIIDGEPGLAQAASESTEATPKTTLTLEVAGAVEKPGLVVLTSGSRVGDAVAAAGGFQKTADKAVINQELNLARVVQDGEKVYIPFTGERLQNKEQTPTSELSSTVKDADPSKVSINTATESELDSLDGIGQARAASIVQNRPYQSLDELITKKVLPQSTYDAIKQNITL
jgi:competence protein ComEA